MVSKIISGGQTGADRAALDFAIKFDIPHGGWIARGRKAEDGPLPKRYQLQEIPEPSYLRRTEKNVIESDGTLIVSRGFLTGGTDYTRKVALEKNRPLLVIDLSRIGAFQAAQMTGDWVAENNIEVLNVAGPRHSKDPAIYKAVFDLLETAFFLSIIDDTIPMSSIFPEISTKADLYPTGLPETVEQAADAFIAGLSFKERTKLANLPMEKLHSLGPEIHGQIIFEFQLEIRESPLFESCREHSPDGDLDADGASEIILKTVWKKLRSKKNIMRIVK